MKAKVRSCNVQAIVLETEQNSCIAANVFTAGVLESLRMYSKVKFSLWRFAELGVARIFKKSLHEYYSSQSLDTCMKCISNNT